MRIYVCVCVCLSRSVCVCRGGGRFKHNIHSRSRHASFQGFTTTAPLHRTTSTTLPALKWSIALRSLEGLATGIAKFKQSRAKLERGISAALTALTATARINFLVLSPVDACHAQTACKHILNRTQPHATAHAQTYCTTHHPTAAHTKRTPSAHRAPHYARFHSYMIVMLKVLSLSESQPRTFNACRHNTLGSVGTGTEPN